jgi:hypothetical protein
MSPEAGGGSREPWHCVEKTNINRIAGMARSHKVTTVIRIAGMARSHKVTDLRFRGRGSAFRGR